MFEFSQEIRNILIWLVLGVWSDIVTFEKIHICDKPIPLKDEDSTYFSFIFLSEFNVKFLKINLEQNIYYHVRREMEII